MLCGATTGEGSRLAASPLWSGVQVALDSMLVNEGAWLLVGPVGAAMFAAPLDGAAYVRSARVATAAVTAGSGGSCAATELPAEVHRGAFAKTSN
ncbi:hypothetical protein CUR178_07509 [Leishmania enriettii]|uniref:Uncharacterized protein n=1 Tax=Leishmania enriettii TaxID=5663 RepID=A0A836KWX3_LEIEN|nr:hypothetical protein CUR178_07509 [Leishmania enriettii]